MLSEDESGLAQDFVAYLNAAQSPFHCVAEVKRRITAQGFTELDERRSWDGTITKGGKYFVSRNGSSIIAFAVGGAFDPETSGLICVGAHTDSPCPKLKPVSTLEKEGHVMLGVVGYGGGLWHTWFDRDLTVVGRALVQEGGRAVAKLVHVPKAICRTPTLAIHLSTADERASFKPNLQQHFPPLLATKIKEALAGPPSLPQRPPAAAAEGPSSLGGCHTPGAQGPASRHCGLLLEVVAKAVGCDPEQILDLELQLADTQPAAVGSLPPIP